VTLRLFAGGLPRAVLGSAAGVLAAAGLLLIAFPRLMTGALASGAFALALSLAWYALARRRRRRDGTRSFEHGG
jgi:hypothetical protein